MNPSQFHPVFPTNSPGSYGHPQPLLQLLRAAHPNLPGGSFFHTLFPRTNPQSIKTNIPRNGTSPKSPPQSTSAIYPSYGLCSNAYSTYAPSPSPVPPRPSPVPVPIQPPDRAVSLLAGSQPAQPSPSSTRRTHPASTRPASAALTASWS